MQLPAYYQAPSLWRFLLKIFFLMRMASLIIILASTAISAKGISQGITLSLKNAPLEQVFTEIKNQSGYNFIYARAQLEKTRNIDLEVSNSTIEMVLSLVFKDQPISYTIEKKFIIIKNKGSEKVSLPASPSIDIIGIVTDPEGKPLQGVSVTVKGTSYGTQTDKKGAFLLKGVDEKAVLIFSFIGYETAEIQVRNRTDYNLQLKLAANSLEETVVKGYYNTTRRLNTGNVSTVTAETISKQPVSNPLAALEGRVPGLYIAQQTGVPGGAFTVQLRGRNSIANGNAPLFIIDGVPFTSASLTSAYTSYPITQGGNPLSAINPSDIESIEILKDADATAIYGSRGANGVILITSKKGKGGQTKIEMNVYTGAGKITRMLDLLNTLQYLAMRHEAFVNDGATPQSYDYDLNGFWDTTRYTNWQQKLIGGTASTLDAQGSVSGGNSNTQFLITGGFHKETTVFPGNFADAKGSVHINLIHSTSDQKFSVSISASYISDKNNLASQDFTGQALILTPVSPAIYDSSGSLNWQKSSWNNPFAATKQKYSSITDNIISNAVISYKVLPGLEFLTNLGFTKMQINESSRYPFSSFDPFSGNPASSYFATNSINTWLIEPQLSFHRNIGKGRLNILFGSTFQQNIRQGQTIFGYGFANDALLENILAAPHILIFDANYTQYRYNAFFGRINYDWSEKYLLNITGRRDGSSRFGPGKQFANFGALGAAWIFTKEKFTQQTFHFLSYGKLRTSFGITGSDQIPDYGWLDLWNSSAAPYLGIQGLHPSRLFNPDFAWEINKKLEASLELGFFKDRILISASYYSNRSSNQLLGLPLPLVTGFPSIQGNLPALVQNTGWELELNAINIKTKNIKWASSINLTLPQNKLISFPNLAASNFVNTYAIGQPLSIAKSYHYQGVDPQTGLYKFVDVDKDGNISWPNDLEALKKLGPVFYGGFQNSLQYKAWQLDIFFQFVSQTGRNYINYYDAPGTFTNQPTTVLNRWQKPGDITTVQKFTQDYSSSTYNAYYNSTSYGDNAIGDASFIRLKNLALSWQLPDKWKQKVHVNNCKIYVQGQNLFTITHYLGMDPENQSFIALPPLKMLTAGIQLSL
jgi:TonB-linked SusC/RagA family outer membrane protein